MDEYIVGLLLGFVLGFTACASYINKTFDGEYDRAKYEWKLNKEKEKQNEQ